MRSTRLIGMMTAAVTGLGSAVAAAEDIALSFVNPKGRIDIQSSAVSGVEGQATITTWNTETGEVRESPDPHVEICLPENVRQRLCQLTQQIVGEPLAIVIACTTVEKPIVREPLCTRPCFQISAANIAEATALAEKIRTGTNKTCAPSD
ncbi:MAG: hypothetical protein ABSE22_06710 [Xanthobacteraceae bacterium]|jgi:preprotein translocase subunit SecD